MKAPVLLIAFNRPDFTSRVFETIRKYKPKKLYMAADGPRDGREGEKNRCEQVRSIVQQVDWECDVQTLFHPRNLGCKIAVSSAIDWFFKNEEQGIILEDDIIPEPSFYQFCEELLERYKDDERIGMISGDNFGFGFRRNQNSYYYSIYSHIWGWASWRRAWKDYDVHMKDYDDFLKSEFLADLFSNATEYNFWKSNFDKVAFENFDTWDFQWVYHNFKNGRLNIMPSVNLIRNIGFGESAAHTKQENQYSNMKTEPMNFPLVHPDYMIRDYKSDLMSQRTFFHQKEKNIISVLRLFYPFRILNRIRRFLLGA
ncbi:glycosyl transferase [Leptospira kmetyi]|uniref:Glycosyl transferase n=1 Tax=Leptospira kmetyi TaxID=408139 RepID=A0ABX4NC99_9LEPT|nr:glycosyl transferase [Leptospira kmetyi]